MLSVVFDIDGVMRRISQRRSILFDIKDWDAAHLLGTTEPANPVALRLSHVYSRRAKVYWVTGIPDEWRKKTDEWLNSVGAPLGNLIMRPTGDKRPSPLFKLDVINNLREVVAIFDDRKDIVDFLHQNHLPAILWKEPGL